MRWLAYSISILAVLAVGTAVVFSQLLLYPSGYVCSKERFVYCGDPSELGLPFEDATFTTADGLKLSAWWIPGNGTAAVILVHGRGVDRHEGMRFVRALHDAGFNLLLPDLRGCGKSQDSMSTMSYYERRDVTAAVDYAVHRGSQRVGVFGFSMGAASSIHAMADDERIRAGIFEGAFAEFSDIVADAARRDYAMPRYPLLPIVTAIFEKRSGARTAAIRPEEAVRRIAPRPVFIIHGSADRRVPIAHGERLYQAAREPRWLWIAPGGAHTSAWQTDPPKAEALAAEFFLKYLQ